VDRKSRQRPGEKRGRKPGEKRDIFKTVKKQEAARKAPGGADACRFLCAPPPVRAAARHGGNPARGAPFTRRAAFCQTAGAAGAKSKRAGGKKYARREIRRKNRGAAVQGAARPKSKKEGCGLEKATDSTKIWELYQKGVEHHNRAGLYSQTQRAHRFFEGDQWAGLESGGENLPVYNFIQPACEYKIAMVAMKSMSVLYSPPPGASGGIAAACRRLGEIAAQGWERTRLERTMWQAVKEACIAGDAWLYFYNSRLRASLSTTSTFIWPTSSRRIFKSSPTSSSMSAGAFARCASWPERTA
jgi:hypothetical protein